MGCCGGKANGLQVHAPTRKEPLPPTLAAAPCGSFQSALAEGKEGRRDFARIFFASEKKIFFIGRGMSSIRPLQPVGGATAASIGDLNEQVTEMAGSLFSESLEQQLMQLGDGTAVDPATLELLRSRAMAAMTVNVGIDFALKMNLVPMYLQPAFVIIVLGSPLEARVATFGFVAGKPTQVCGDRPESKRTPFCVRLLSPNLLGDTTDWEVEYNVRELQVSSILQAVELDLPQIRSAAAAGRWDPLIAKRATE